MKKIIAMLLALVMVLGLAACASKTEPAQPEEPAATETTPAAEETTEEPAETTEEPATTEEAQPENPRLGRVLHHRAAETGLWGGTHAAAALREPGLPGDPQRPAGRPG